MAIDLKTGIARPAQREDYCTKVAGARPGGECPIWLAFLDRITGKNPEIQKYLQRVAGYCTTGVTSEHVLFFLYGTGANGKSVFISTLVGILGELFSDRSDPTPRSEPS